MQQKKGKASSPPEGSFFTPVWVTYKWSNLLEIGTGNVSSGVLVLNDLK